MPIRITGYRERIPWKLPGRRTMCSVARIRSSRWHHFLFLHWAWRTKDKKSIYNKLAKVRKTENIFFLPPRLAKDMARLARSTCLNHQGVVAKRDKNPRQLRCPQYYHQTLVGIIKITQQRRTNLWISILRHYTKTKNIKKSKKDCLPRKK